MEPNGNSIYSEYRQQLGGSQNNSGLLKYRSAPSILLENLANELEKREKISERSCFEDGEGARGFASLNSQLPPQYPRPSGSLGMEDGGFAGIKSMGMDSQDQPKMGSNLLRKNSIPAGFFYNSSARQHGYDLMRGINNYRMPDFSANGESSPTSSRSKISSVVPSSFGVAVTNCENRGSDSKVGNFNSEFPFGSWNHSSNFMDAFSSGVKKELDDDQKLLCTPQNDEEPDKWLHKVSHHSTSSEVENISLSHDMVPCKIRAKRGCATHPRSIAERVRRTRISERMRKLQELVPNMDKQTSTADMLDLSAEYIKNLQKQYKTLSDSRENCRCSASHRMVLNQIP